MPLWNRGKDKAVTAATAPFTVPPTNFITGAQHYSDAAELARTGSRGRATITSVTFGGEQYGQAMWTIGMRVEPDNGQAFDAELALMLDGGFGDGAPREIGETAAVVFDPGNPAQVRFLPPHLASDGA